MKSLLLLSFLPSLVFGCYAGYSLVYDGLCVEQIRTGSPENYEDTKKTCDANDAELPMLHSKEEENYMKPMYNNYWSWIGLRCDGEKFVWEDGTVATYTNFEYTETCNSENVNRRYYTSSTQQWRSYSDGNQGTNWPVCVANIRSWICDTYYLLELGKSEDMCYLVNTQLTAQPAAESNCESQRAHVTSIHDKDLNDFVKRTGVAYGMTNGVLLGLKYVNGKYVWSDGSKVDYTNFAPGFPDETFGECVAMGINLFPGKWMNSDCSTPLPYICTKPSLSYDESVAPAGCNDDDDEFYPGDEVFSPTWGSATGPALCDYALMDLDKSKKVTVEILFFESNSCCDTLTIYDGLTGAKVLKTLTGYYGFTSINVTATSNAIRLEWNAKSGAHVRGWHARVSSA